MTEKTIQMALWRYFDRKHHVMICPNVTTRYGEADLLTRTRAGMLHEVEIKISLADFGAEFRRSRRSGKPLKHTLMGKLLAGEKDLHHGVPNYFWFAVPCELMHKIAIRVPDHAGLIVVRQKAQVVVEAPRLHGRKASDWQVHNMARSVMNHFWYREERRMRRQATAA